MIGRPIEDLPDCPLVHLYSSTLGVVPVHGQALLATMVLKIFDILPEAPKVAFPFPQHDRWRCCGVTRGWDSTYLMASGKNHQDTPWP